MFLTAFNIAIASKHWCGQSVCTDIEVACYGYEGVDAVKNSLKKGLNMSTDDMPIRVTYLCVCAMQPLN